MTEAIDETSTNARLIAASLVSGTAVYNPDGAKIGRVEDIMIDKWSGQARYAIISFGGFLGIGEKHHPLPWNTLKYDPALGGYLVNLTPIQLQNAPTLGRDEKPGWNDEAWGQRLDEYYTPAI